MTDTKHIPLEIEPVNPGFIVREGAGFNPGGYRPALFACTTIDEALGFIRDRLAPVASVGHWYGCICSACKPVRDFSAAIGDWQGA